MARIKFDDISFSYGDKKILDHFSLEVDDSRIMCLLGPSGCGKTTLARCLLGFCKPETGEIWIGDRCVFSKKRRINVSPEKRGVGMVFQDYAVWPHMTVYENVCYPMKKKKVPADKMKEKAEKALNQVRMLNYAPYLPSQLSGGQQQRVAIARALVSSDEIIVMDEPITNLDAKLREEMLIEIREIQKTIGTTIFYITHDQEASLHLCDEMAIMNNKGNLCQIGNDEDIILRPADRFVFEFIGVSNFFRLINRNGKWYFKECDNVQFEGKVPEEFKDEEEIELGIRPNGIVFDDKSKVKARVKNFVFLGSEYSYFLDLNGREIRVERNAFNVSQDLNKAKIGDNVGLSFENPRFYKIGKEEE